MMDRQTGRRMDARGKTICLPTLPGGDIIEGNRRLFLAISDPHLLIVKSVLECLLSSVVVELCQLFKTLLT